MFYKKVMIMKKSIFVAVILGAALLSACKPDKGKDAVTGITINPSELTLYPGDDSRLSISVTPENAKYNSDDLVWESSDTTIVVVSQNGTVTALAEGKANITVTYKELKSACAVTVSSWIKDLFFTGVYFGISDTAAYGDKLDTIQSISGEDFYVKLVESYIGLFTAGFYLNNEGEFAGASRGGILEAHAPMYYAPGWANNSDHGTYFCLGDWYIYDTLMAQCMPVGHTNSEYLQYMHLFIENIVAGDATTAYTQNLKDAGEKGCEGSLFTVYEYHTTAEGYGEDGYYSSYIPDLFGVSGYFEAGDNYIGSNILCSVENHHLSARELKNTEADANDNFYVYGCYLHYNEASEDYTWNDEIVHFEDPYVYDYNLEEALGAPARRGVKTYKEVRNVHSMAETKQFVEKLRSTPHVMTLTK